MKYHNWNPDKNELLKHTRGISFNDIVYYLEHGHLIEIIEHPDQDLYKNQKMYIMNISDYIYLVPFMESEDEIFMKTIIPSRKATKQYLENLK